MTHEMYETLMNMERFGGAFVRKLTLLYWAADRSNKAKLEAVFPEYFEKYHPDNWGKKEKPNAN